MRNHSLFTFAVCMTHIRCREIWEGLERVFLFVSLQYVLFTDEETVTQRDRSATSALGLSTSSPLQSTPAFLCARCRLPSSSPHSARLASHASNSGCSVALPIRVFSWLRPPHRGPLSALQSGAGPPPQPLLSPSLTLQTSFFHPL